MKHSDTNDSTEIPAHENNLGDLAHNLGKKVGDLASCIKSNSADFTNLSREYIKENPGKSIAIAASLGALAGSLIALGFNRHWAHLKTNND